MSGDEDLDRFASEEEPDVPALRGWRHEILGEDAIVLKQSRLALVVKARELTRRPAAGRDRLTQRLLVRYRSDTAVPSA